MSENSSETFGEVVWRGKPWILPSVIARTILIIIVSFLIIWLEFYTNSTNDTIANVPLVLWTAIVFLIIWIISLSDLLLLRASNTYILRKDSLEIKTGIANLKQFAIVPSGFSDLEVTQSLLERAIGYGSIIIRTQSEIISNRTMVKVRNPTKIAEQIRYIMARHIVRLDQPPTKE